MACFKDAEGPLDKKEQEEAIQNNSNLHPEGYTIAALLNLKNGLSRCLSFHGKSIDLTTDENFRESQRAFKDACKKLKQLGKGIVHIYLEISHPLMDPDRNPQTLQNKVQWDIHFYFVRTALINLL